METSPGVASALVLTSRAIWLVGDLVANFPSMGTALLLPVETKVRPVLLQIYGGPMRLLSNTLISLLE